MYQNLNNISTAYVVVMNSSLHIAVNVVMAVSVMKNEHVVPTKPT